jgi:class 3 adenylate cyclase
VNRQAIVLIVVTGIAVVAAVVVFVTLTLVRRRRTRRRALEARRRELKARRLSPLEATGVLGLAATIEGVRLAVRVGTELRRGLAPVVAGSLRRLADLAESDRPALEGVTGPDGTVTLMFSDIEGSTALNERLGDEAWLDLLKKHDAIVRREVRAHRGEVVKTQGDSFMVAFRAAPVAVSCAIGIQRALARGVLASDPPVRVRIGLHAGEVTKQGRDLFGLNVAIAARVADEATGGEILVSSAVRNRAAQADGVHYGEGRRVQLKGISETETVYPIRWQVSDPPRTVG